MTSKTTQKTDADTIAMLARTLPLYDGETILWYREADHGYELRVRCANGTEGMHDVYSYQLTERDPA
jgi:hypothetical protein